MGVSKNRGGNPKMDGLQWKNPTKMDDLGVFPYFWKHPYIYIYIHIHIHIYIYIHFWFVEVHYLSYLGRQLEGFSSKMNCQNAGFLGQLERTGCRFWALEGFFEGFLGVFRALQKSKKVGSWMKLPSWERLNVSFSQSAPLEDDFPFPVWWDMWVSSLEGTLIWS